MSQQVVPALDKDDLSLLGDAILRAIHDAVMEEAERHRRLGLPMVTCKDGKVVWLRPEELPTADSQTEQSE